MRGVAVVLAEAGADRVREFVNLPALLAEQRDPDVVVLDVAGSRRAGLREHVRLLLSRHPVVALSPGPLSPGPLSPGPLSPSPFSPGPDGLDVAGLLRDGVRGCVPWDAGAVALVDAVRRAATLGHRRPRSPVTGRAEQTIGRTLTAREREVLRSVSDGLTHKEVARLLGLSKATVDTYVQRIRQKLGVGNKAELARVAYRLRLGADD
jgi:DNA-binding NarL/FixJ family response regulator